MNLIDLTKLKVIDITRELMSTSVYPGDPAPSLEPVLNIREGDACNLTKLTMGAHNGTHADAPLHFIENGADIASVPPEVFVGECLVRTFKGEVSSQDIVDLPEDCVRLLLKGGGIVIEAAAEEIVRKGIRLVGIEGSSVGRPEDPKPVHMILLGAGIIALENLDLSQVSDGVYFLAAQPLKIAGCEGSPCRALLLC